jgi:hypothetical protein
MATYVTARDWDIFRALARCPLTVRQMEKVSVTFAAPFRSERRLQRRLHALAAADLVRQWRYATPGPGVPCYYTLSPESYRLLYGHDAILPSHRAFEALADSRHHHTHSLAEFIVHMTVAARDAQASIGDFTRENTLKLSIADDELYPDCSFILTLPGRPPFQFYVELDNSTEALGSPRAHDSWLRKIRFYERLQNSSPTRFRVLGIMTKSRQRRANIAALAATVATNPQRSLFLGAYLPEFLENLRPLTSPVFADHRGLHVSMLPAMPPLPVEKSGNAFHAREKEVGSEVERSRPRAGDRSGNVSRTAGRSPGDRPQRRSSGGREAIGDRPF